MESADRQAWLALPPILVIGGAIAWAGSQGGVTLHTPLGPWPLFAVCGALAFCVNWVVFLHAWPAQTERYCDLTGSPRKGRFLPGGGYSSET